MDQHHLLMACLPFRASQKSGSWLIGHIGRLVPREQPSVQCYRPLITMRCQLLDGYPTLQAKRKRRQKQRLRSPVSRGDRIPEAIGDTRTRMVARYPSDQTAAWCDKGL